ncbi:MAG: potassium transporter Kup [Acidimicrobiia bacterium]|nr:potassium transporter Kup [Acidimicrobiia bacterium]
MAFGALGIVYGDIGTSPLYAMREAFHGHGHEMAVSSTNVLGLLSLIFWSLILIIGVKYITFVMRADNDGEGGILALTALLPRDGQRGHRRLLVLLGIFGTALLYGDGMITPAISVLSAVEGTREVTDRLDGLVVPISVGIIIGLFSIQRHGTAAVARLFGPVMVVWFGVLGALGVVHILGEPSVLAAINPLHAVDFFLANGMTGFLSLGSVFLVVTGGEALYADMGHFGRRPIQFSWFALVLPALVLNYFGQGALLISDPDAIVSPFFRMAPSWGTLPLVVLATMATVIASQALISGIFSLTMQGAQLGYVPRVNVRHTSSESFGQIYIPGINWALMVACVALVIGFGSSGALAAAYGVAVTSTMVITTLIFYVVLRQRWGWTLARAAALCGMFLVVESAYFAANLFKIPAGGWFPLVVAAVVFTLMTTWSTGRRLVGERIQRAKVPLEVFFESMLRSTRRPHRTAGTGIYLFSTPGMTPPALMANVRHNDVIHEQLIVLAIVTDVVPRVLPARRSEVTPVVDGVWNVVLHYGFMEDPDIRVGLGQGPASRLAIDTATASYFLGAESLVVTKRPGMMMWRDRLFTLLSRNATSAATYFGLPPDRTVTLGQSVEL